MTVGYLAHSAKDDCPAQSYAAHITGVWNRVARYAAEAERFGKYPGHLLRLAKQSALRHDLGKLDDANQAVRMAMCIAAACRSITLTRAARQ